MIPVSSAPCAQTPRQQGPRCCFCRRCPCSLSCSPLDLAATSSCSLDPVRFLGFNRSWEKVTIASAFLSAALSTAWALSLSASLSCTDSSEDWEFPPTEPSLHATVAFLASRGEGKWSVQRTFHQFLQRRSAQGLPLKRRTGKNVGTHRQLQREPRMHRFGGLCKNPHLDTCSIAQVIANCRASIPDGLLTPFRLER